MINIFLVYLNLRHLKWVIRVYDQHKITSIALILDNIFPVKSKKARVLISQCNLISDEYMDSTRAS